MSHNHLVGQASDQAIVVGRVGTGPPRSGGQLPGKTPKGGQTIHESHPT
jgi:hypothetical protein